MNSYHSVLVWFYEFNLLVNKDVQYLSWVQYEDLNLILFIVS